jgi:branched-chain amino acid transport system ATP-binding protein
VTDLLVLDDVSAAYGPYRALFHISFAVGEGEAVALLGTNGAGKTSVARVATGLLAPTSGQVVFDGHDLTNRRTFEFARAGVIHAPEGRSVFASLTVEENLVLAFREVVGRAGARDALDQAYELFPRLGERRRQNAGSLSGGEQRMLALARVLVHPPRLLVVDELSLGLAPIIIEDVYRNLARLKERGVALVVVEQQVEHALELADRVVVLSRGEVSYDGPVVPPEELAPYFLPDASDAEVAP